MALKCDICNVAIQSELVMAAHVKGKKHQHLAGIHERRKQQAEHSAYISGDLKKTSPAEVKQHFTSYGAVEHVYINREKGFGFVEFKEKESVSKAVDGKNTVGEVELTVQPRHFKSISHPHQGRTIRQRRNQPRGHRISPATEAFHNKLRAAESVSHQMTLIKEEMQLSEEDLAQRQELVQTLQAHFRTIFPAATVEQFGSSVTGLGTKGSDMDIFLDLHLPEPDHPDSEIELDLKELTFLVGEDGRITRGSFKKAQIYEQIKAVGRILLNPSVGCREVFCVTNARCPVVKFLHEPTGIHCDLSLNNRLALRNTQLLQILTSGDPRVKELIFTIRYWAKIKGLAGNMNSGPRLTNYALTLIIIYFLQNLPDPVLPSVEQLANLADADNPWETVTIDGWNCSFTQDPEKFPISTNSLSSEELLKGFMQFYSNFDLGSVICPRTGQNIEVPELKTSADYAPKFKISPLNVQDPFVLEHNTAHNVNWKTKDRIIAELRLADARVQHSQFTKSETSKDWGLCYLISSLSASALVRKGLPSQTVRKKAPYHFVLEFRPSKLDYALFRDCRSMLQVKAAWVLQTCRLLLRSLRELLLFDCEERIDRCDEWISLVDHIYYGSKFDMLVEAGNLEAENVETGDQEMETVQDSEAQIPATSEIELSEPNPKVALKRMSQGTKDVEAKKMRLTSEQKGNGATPPSEEDVKPSLEKDVESNPFLSSIVRAGMSSSSSQAPGNLAPLDLPEGKNLADLSTTEMESVPLMVYYCSTVRFMWASRKAARKIVRTKMEEESQSLEEWSVEEQVTKYLEEQGAHVNKTPVTQCTLQVFVEGMERGDTSVVVECIPTKDLKEFINFFPFFKTFFLKLGERCLLRR